jgi:uncharacterized protein
MIDNDIKKCIDNSVLCWLATCDDELFPNVSPKEMFTYKDESTLLIANLASPNSINNMVKNPNVCVSFIDIFLQKGYKLQGKATIIDKENLEFSSKAKPIIDLFTDQFPIKSIIEIAVTKIDTIQAPSYFLYPERTEQFQIESAMKTYKVKPLDER